jgi:hypothetical protein
VQQDSATVPAGVRHVAQYCSHLLKLIIRISTNKKGCDLRLAETIGESGVKSHHIMFGGNLDDILAAQIEEQDGASSSGMISDGKGNNSDVVPHVVKVCLDQVMKHDGAATKGIFRLAGDKDEIGMYKTKLESGDFSFSGLDNPHTPADIVKQFLRQLEVPLFPQDMYEKCLAASLVPAECEEITMRLPKNHLATTDYLLRWLGALADHHPITSMTEDNLAIVFCSNILRKDSMDTSMLLKNAGAEKRFVTNLIHAWQAKRLQQ